MGNSTVVEQIGILESYEHSGKWIEMVISGKESSMKYGYLRQLAFVLPDRLWYKEVEAITKVIPRWPEGARVKHVHGEIVAIWIPTKSIWLREKRR